MQTKTIVKNFIFTIMIGFSAIAAAQDPFERTCVVSEVLDSDGYSYIRCREGSSEYWVAAPSATVGPGEQISFADSSPLVNFTNKTLNRTFPRIYFASNVSRSVEIRNEPSSNSAPHYPAEYTKTDDTNSVYRWQSEDGAVVLTDDESRIPEEKRQNRFKITRKSKYIMFVDEDEYIGSQFKAFYDANNINDVGGHKMIIVHALLQPESDDGYIFEKKEMYFDVDCQEQIASPIRIVDAGNELITSYEKAVRKIAKDEEFISVSASLYHAICD